MTTAREEYEIILAQKTVNTALNKQPPPATMITLTPAIPLYVFREILKRWTGPYQVISSDRKKVLVDLRGKPVQEASTLLKLSHCNSRPLVNSCDLQTLLFSLWNTPIPILVLKMRRTSYLLQIPFIKSD